jgi:cytochrome b subunit of formate dehydrogenase
MRARGPAGWGGIGLAVLVLAAGAAAAQESACTDCHDVDVAKVAASVHGFLDCTDCHAGADQEPHGPDVAAPACATCHAEEVEDFQQSVHGEAKKAAGESWLSGCLDCHGEAHGLLAADDPASPVHPERLAETCASCHADPAMAKRYEFRLVQPIQAYLASVHARALKAGEKAATCSSCHGTHAIFRAVDPRSKVNHQRVPDTCGQCHTKIAATYRQSVHGQAAAHGILEAPVCTDCHGEHRILGPADKGSPVFATNVPLMTCGRCHGDLRVTEKFGLKANAVTAFEDSFHGLAGRTGSLSVANCASCHGVHDILPSSDPRSHVNPANLATTCGSCHPGAGKNFAIGTVHVLPRDRESAHPAVYWVRAGYIWLIWLTIGGMALHNILDLRRKALSPMPRLVVPRSERRLRLSLPFRIAHWMLLSSFIVLVWTGFALKYPDTWFAQPLLQFENGLAFRGWVHRIAAIVMLSAFAFHAVHLAVDRRARACIRGMMPGFEDLHELREKVRWFLGRRPEMPRSPALGYAEKAEYLALVWGTVVMAFSGFILWFENWSLANLPKWASDVATVVHFYEAVLASLAIVVWHFYFVIYDPLVYPMDTAWLHGREAPGRALERTAATLEPKPKEAEPAKKA